MDESDSEDGLDFDHEAPLYPIEGKFRSEADRAEVMAMTEIRREEILAERAAEVERRVQDLQLKKILQESKLVPIRESAKLPLPIWTMTISVRAADQRSRPAVPWKPTRENVR